jgi:hypothetical protein
MKGRGTIDYYLQKDFPYFQIEKIWKMYFNVRIFWYRGKLFFAPIFRPPSGYNFLNNWFFFCFPSNFLLEYSCFLLRGPSRSLDAISSEEDFVLE